MTTDRNQFIADVVNEELRLRECYADAMEANNMDQAAHYQMLSHFMSLYSNHLMLGTEEKLELELKAMSMKVIPRQMEVALTLHELQTAGLVSIDRMKAVMARMMKFTFKAFDRRRM